MSASTKEKILDTAERQFAEKGFDATSLRHIIAEAGVNLAAIHYHFGSKEGLLDAIVLRKVTPVNASRLELLDAAEKEAGDGAAPIERVLEAFILPTFTLKLQQPAFCQLMGRVHAEGLMMRLMYRNFQPTVERFMSAFRRALPGLPERELHWRVHFTIGAMSHALRANPPFLPVADGEELDGAGIAQRLIAFCAAGMRAPVLSLEEK